MTRNQHQNFGQTISHSTKVSISSVRNHLDDQVTIGTNCACEVKGLVNVTKYIESRVTQMIVQNILSNYICKHF